MSTPSGRNTEPSRPEPRHRTRGSRDEGSRIELAAALVLGLAAVLTAYASYRGSLVGDEVLKNYSDSSVAVADAFDSFSLGDQAAMTENDMYLQYGLAITAGNVDGADFLLSQMTPELITVIDEWEANPDLQTPFDDANPYVADLESSIWYADAEERMDQAASMRAAAEVADGRTDVYDRAQVFFAVTLFVAGFTALLRRSPIQWVTLTLAGLMLVLGLVDLIDAESVPDQPPVVSAGELLTPPGR